MYPNIRNIEIEISQEPMEFCVTKILDSLKKILKGVFFLSYVPPPSTGGTSASSQCLVSQVLAPPKGETWHCAPALSLWYQSAKPKPPSSDTEEMKIPLTLEPKIAFTHT